MSRPETRLGLWALLACAGACIGRSPTAVADRFVDAYFVEMDQGRALGLASGLAKEMLDRELRDVAAVRRQTGFMPADARPDVFYERIAGRDAGDRKIFTYALTLRLKGDITHKSAQIALAQQGSDWKVVFYRITDGEPAR